jgi:uncharacterized protein YgbK (DUF1537 family)
MPLAPAPRIAFYGDDFTGSTDALEFLCRAGVPTKLFLRPPTPSQLARSPDLQGIGMAGKTRSLPTEAMADELRPALEALRALGVPHVHYKVCSTFDSSPAIGSIGRAIDVGAEIFGGRFVPLLVGAPASGRYCVFGNLFARFGGNGAIHRLDRHPSMSRHPVTPADESDLRRHLGRQTAKKSALLDILQVSLPQHQALAALDRLVAEGAEVVLFDLMDERQLAPLGALIDAQASRDRPLFSVGSSGIEMALGARWRETLEISPKTDWPLPAAVNPLLVISGSCSPVTAAQIDWAEAHGFAAVPLDQRAADKANAALSAGCHTVVYSGRGPLDSAPRDPEEIGGALGRLAGELLARHGLRRLVVAGGDTSSYAARALGIESLEMIAPLTPGAPLCRASAPGFPADALEINFKGGQVGSPEYFGRAADPSYS